MLTPGVTGRELWDLLAPLEPGRFVAEHWDRKPLVLPGARDKFDRLFGLRLDEAGFRATVRALAAQEPEILRATAERGSDVNGIVRASFDHRPYVSGQARRPFTQIRPQQMDAMLAAGASIQLGGLESMTFGDPADARFAVCAEALRAALHYPGDVLVGATLSPPRARFEAHFDPTGAFILQTAGEKLYQFSREPVVPWPRGKAYVGADGVARYSGSRSGGEDWEQAQVDLATFGEPVLMRAGDLFYIPPGVVHRTEARDAWSVSVLVIFGQTSFRHLVDHLLERLTLADPAWRRLPVWLDAPDGELPAEVRGFLGERLEELRALLGTLRPDGLELARIWQERVAFSDVWSAPAVPPEDLPVQRGDVFVVSRRVPLVHACGADREGAVGLHLFRGKAELSVPEEWAPFLRRLLREERFSAEAACGWSVSGTPYDWDDVAACLESLLETGVIEREPARGAPPQSA